MEITSYILGKKAGGGGGGEPTETLNITSNGTKNVKNYAYANVNVPPKVETKSITISENGITTVTPTSGKDGISSLQITTNVSDIDWTEIGYTEPPKIIKDGFDYAKEIYDNWDATITNTGNMFRDDGELVFFPNVDTSNITSAASMFNLSGLNEIDDFDFSNIDNAASMFRNTPLRKIGDVNVKNGCSMKDMFHECRHLEEIKSIHITAPYAGGGYDITYLLANCINLKTIGSITTNLTQATPNAGTKYTHVFANCNSLTDESLNKVLGFLKQLTDQPQDKRTLNYFGVPEALLDRIVLLSNWTDLVNAGWTPGY